MGGRYPTTVLAALVGVLAIVAGAAVWLTADASGQRFGQVVLLAGVIVQAVLATYRGETATHAARRADDGVQAASAALVAAGVRADDNHVGAKADHATAVSDRRG